MFARVRKLDANSWHSSFVPGVLSLDNRYLIYSSNLIRRGIISIKWDWVLHGLYLDVAWVLR